MITVAILGLGRIGYKFHFNRCVDDDRFHLIAVVDKERSRLDEAQQQHAARAAATRAAEVDQDAAGGHGEEDVDWQDRVVDGDPTASLARAAARAEKAQMQHRRKQLETFESAELLWASSLHFDVVVIAMPTAMHRKLAVQALQRGSHVVLEKPAAATVSDVDMIAAAAEVSGKQVFVFQPRE